MALSAVRRLPLTARVVAALAVLLVLIAGTGAFAVARLQSLGAVQVSADRRAVLVEQLLAAQLAARAAANDERGFLLTRETSFAEEQRGRQAAVTEALGKARAAAPDLGSTLDALAADYAAWQKAVDAEVALHATDPAAARAAALGPNRALRKAFEAHVTTLQKSEDAARAARAAAAAADADTTTRVLAGLVLVAVAAGVAVAIALVRGVRRPLSAAVTVLRSAAGGDLGGRLPVHGRDEIAQLAGAVNDTLTSFEDSVRVMRSNAGALTRVSGELSAASAGIEGTARETSARAGSVATAADDVAESVQTVASGSEQMGASMGEIARSVQDAVRMADEGVQVATATTAVVDELGQSSAEIGNVVKVITSIAEQTNLLALNATIEAARAGDAGRGFAVVAGEVKELAQETARATEVISGKVEAIQGVTGNVVTSMQEIGRIIEQINGFQAAIAAAVEEQTQVTSAMNDNVSGAAAAGGRIAETISGVADAARATSEQVAVARGAAADLETMARELEALTARFRA